MIVRDKEQRFRLLFVWHGTVLPKVLPNILAIMALSIMAWLLNHYQVYSLSQVPAVGISIFAVIISIFLGFRNHACYDRWWEGRKLWGALVANTRHLSRDSHFLPAHEREMLLLEMLVFVALLRDRLRGQPIQRQQFQSYIQLDDDFLKQIDTEVNAPQRLLERMQQRLIANVQQQHISDMIYMSIQKHIIEMGNVQAGCDRIFSTPLPFPYSVLLHRAVFAFCWILPFALSSMLGFWSVLLVGFISYLLLGLDELSHQLEEPFGNADHDLPLDSMVRNIERETLTLLNRPIPETLPYEKPYYHH